ncbi:MAG: AtpZ/AtpI family protein [Planctomycetes bacterium]|nr:AtpZ/AtpI family protein [Planctomycetota bacterium]
MGNVSNHENRSLEWWRSLASRLAFLFAATILICSGIGLWFSGEMRDLQHLYDKLKVEIEEIVTLNGTLAQENAEIVTSNETIAQENTKINQIAKTRLDTIEKLKIRNYELTVKHNTLLMKLESENRPQ